MSKIQKSRWFSTNYPGGNIVVEKMDKDCVWLSPDWRHMQEGKKWFYWSFQAHNKRPITVVFSHRNYLSVHGPAISHDDGIHWNWAGRDAVHENPISDHLIEYSFEIPPVESGTKVRYAFCPQYQQSDWERWLKQHQENPVVKISELCKSRNGRSVEMLRIAEGSPCRKILLMARNHSCEAMASFVLEGILEAALSTDAVGKQFRKNWELIATPFMDKDGVEEGDQGKLRYPHDHNRDYNENPIYPEVAAAMHWGKEHKSSVAAFLDLHCPMVHGPWDNRFYLVGSPFSKVEVQQEAFMDVFGKFRSGQVDRYNNGILRFGEAWNTNVNFADGKCAAVWAAENFQTAEIIASFEIPYANSGGVEVTPDSARALGRDLVVGLLHHLRKA